MVTLDNGECESMSEGEYEALVQVALHMKRHQLKTLNSYVTMMLAHHLL